MESNHSTPLEAILRVIHGDYECAILLLEQHGDLAKAIQAAEATAARRDVPSQDRRMARRAGHILASRRKPGGQEEPDEILARLRAAQDRILAGDPPDDGLDTVFAETTVQWDKFMKGEPRRRAILSAIALARCFTSAYVFAELDKGLGNHFRILRHKAQEATDIASLNVSAADGQAGWGEFSAAWLLIQNLVAREKKKRGLEGMPMTGREDMHFVVALCERYLNSGIEIELRDHMDGILESFPTHAPLGQPLWRADLAASNPVWRCSRDRSNCGLPDFLCTEPGAFTTILTALQGQTRPDRETINRLSALTKVFGQQGQLDPPNGCAGRGRNCHRLSDAILAVECPDCAELYTTDKHFDVLCPALGKTRWGPPSQSASAAQPSPPGP